MSQSWIGSKCYLFTGKIFDKACDCARIETRLVVGAERNIKYSAERRNAMLIFCQVILSQTNMYFITNIRTKASNLPTMYFNLRQAKDTDGFR